MGDKSKALVVWLLGPYLAVFVILPGLLYVFGHYPVYGSLQYWKGQLIVLCLCAIPALAGTAVLWLLPVRRAASGVILGSGIAIAGVVLHAWLAVTFRGSFEGNASIVVAAWMLLVPSVLAGSYAGILRSREGRKSA